MHDRMPVIIDEADFERWLDPTIQDARDVADLLRPFPAELMASVPVSIYVNKPENDGPRCIEPLTGEAGG